MTIKYPPQTEIEFLRRYLEFANILLPEEQRLVPKEVDLIVEFALLPSKFEHQRFKSLAKDKVIESTKEKGWKLTKLNVNNKIYALLDKKFLHRDIDGVIYLPKHLLFALSEFRKNKSFLIKVQFLHEEDPSSTEKEVRPDSTADSAET